MNNSEIKKNNEDQSTPPHPPVVYKSLQTTN